MADSTALNQIWKRLNETLCYQLLPQSSKLVILDSSLTVKKALALLIQNKITYAPLLKNDVYAGMITVTDFISLILALYHGNKDVNPILSDIKGDFKLSVNPMSSILLAAKSLLEYKLHRMPLVDSFDHHDTIVGVLDHYKILSFIAKTCPLAISLSFTPQSMQIGTFSDLYTITPTTSLLNVLNLFIEHNLSALPIVDEHNKVLDVLEKYDIMNLSRDGGYYNLEMLVEDCIKRRESGFSGTFSVT